MISTSRTSDFQIPGSAISSHKNIQKSRSYLNILFGEVLFLTTPDLMVRAFRHTALGAHWFNLFALYYYLEYRSKKDAKLPWQMILLSALTVGIHPYFLPMVMIFVLLTVVEAFIKRYPTWRIITFAGLSVAFPYGLGVAIGALGTGIENTRGGYGYAGLDLNTLFNPKRYGGYVWSHVLPQGEQVLEMKEGFCYLGFGVLLMGCVCMFILVLEVILGKTYIKRFWKIIQKNIPLICGMLFMTLFAVTNLVTWDNKLLLSFPLPEKLLEYANIFRASTRMFYPVYYLIILVLIYYLLEIPWKKVGTILLGIMMIIQVWDLRDVFLENHMLMEENYNATTIMDDEVLAGISEKELLVLVGTENFELQRALAIWVAKHDMGVCYSIANTGNYDNCEIFTYDFADNMSNGLIQDEIVYVTLDESVMQAWREVLKAEEKEYVEYKRGYYYFIYTE